MLSQLSCWISNCKSLLLWIQNTATLWSLLFVESLLVEHHSEINGIRVILSERIVWTLPCFDVKVINCDSLSKELYSV